MLRLIVAILLAVFTLTNSWYACANQSGDDTGALSSPVIPGPPPSATPSPATHLHSQQTLVISLPQVFSGCWKGDVLNVDSLRTLNGSGFAAVWEPKTFEVCFVRRGRGRWLLTYSSWRLATAVPAFLFQPISDSLRLLSGNRADTIVLESTIKFRDIVSVKDETATIVLHPDGSVMHARGAVTAGRNGIPWVASTWHTDFHLTGEGPGN